MGARLEACSSYTPVGSGLVIAYTFKRASQSYDEPDPVTEARIEEEREAA